MSWFKKLRGDPAAAVTAEPGKPETRSQPVKPPADHQTAADMLNWLCHERGCTYHIERGGGEPVKIVLIWPDGDRASGKGSDTRAALHALLDKLEVAL